MGLDMYLYGKKFIGFDKKEEKKLTKYFNLGFSPRYIVFDLIYWRKSNAIHQWFVENVQDGNDDCSKYYVNKNQLKELLNIIKKVLKNRGKAHELLPTQGGFFFGDTDYNKYYFDDLKRTKKELSNILNDKKFDDLDFEYHSSW